MAPLADRYGQQQAPVIHYLLTISANTVVRGDLRVLDRLIEKKQEAHKNIGDAGHPPGAARHTQQRKPTSPGRSRTGHEPDEIIPDQPAEVDWLSAADRRPPRPPPLDDGHVEPLSLYADDLTFAPAAFDELQDSKPIRPARSTIPPAVLLLPAADEPAAALPVHPARGDPTRLALPPNHGPRPGDAGHRRRPRHEGEWPQEQLFWELHPVTDWLMDKLLVRFGRHEAPMMVAPSCPPATASTCSRACSPTSAASR